ncbi:MAG: UDP-N-acetylglucosamine--N-acetylmuramyl-(pentapeptide) pyrophosphoryl-undecaprenol N-acetylglucosamine transferase [Candidatus Parcubacteria bacterium]|nr:UDP-N-acetylglucosamine--N-acetylmuramyl-(pentapeptide) pyrophosphoryl-undecaprenol N-acetylglucosamine transferase [Candidatus Parcubacteria bacterium]
MKIIFTGGGTAGHIIPIIAIVREIRKIRQDDLKLYYIGPRDEFSSVLLRQEGVIMKTVLSGKLRRYISVSSVIKNIIDILRIGIGIIQAFFLILFIRPNLIFSKGGHGSIPAAAAGVILHTPIFIHESDVVPGLANQIFSRFASNIFTAFPKTEYFLPSKTTPVGNPVRKEILEGSKEEAKEVFSLTGGKPVILILGGSQGAQRINDTVLNIIGDLLAEFEIIHQCGENNYKQIREESRVAIPDDLQKYYHLSPFLKEPDLKDAYQICDLIVSRAGSGSIFEIAALGKPSILIPLPEAAQDHQSKNAYAYAKTGAAIVIEKENMTPHFFRDKIRYLFSHPSEMETMSQKAKEFSKPDAARINSENLLTSLTK